MKRRSFLTLLGLAPLAPAAAAQVVKAVAPVATGTLTPVFALRADDWRYCARVANIDVSELVPKRGFLKTDSALIEQMSKMVAALPERPGRTAIFLNRTAYQEYQHEKRWGWLRRLFTRRAC